MCLDECPPADTPRRTYCATPFARTIRWAERCRAAHRRTDQALFAIVQGGTDLELRGRCAAALTALDFPGYALGGFSVGETPEQMVAALDPTAALLPADKPRYLMGVGRPEDILAGVARGIDMFDCVLPTRNGRNASAFTDDGAAAAAQRLPQARSGRRWSPVVRATRAATSAGRTCTICSWRRRCWGRRCCRCTTWRFTAG